MTVVLCGCASPPDSGPDSAPPIDAAAMQSAPPTSAATLLPLRERSGVYRVTRGNKQSEDVPFRLEPAGKPDSWRLTSGDVRVANLRREPDDRIVMVSEVERGEGVQVTYDPPLLQLPAALASGSPATQDDVATKVTNLSNGAERDHGVTTTNIEVLGLRTVSTPAGDFEAVIVRTTRRMRLGFAEVDVVIHHAFAPNVGIVAENIDRTTKVIGMFQTRVREDWRLAE